MNEQFSEGTISNRLSTDQYLPFSKMTFVRYITMLLSGFRFKSVYYTYIYLNDVKKNRNKVHHIIVKMTFL